MKLSFFNTLLILALLAPNILSAQVRSVKRAAYFRESLPLRSVEPILPGERDRSWKDHIIQNRNIDEFRKNVVPHAPSAIDNAWQKAMGSDQSRGPLASFDGVGNVNGVLPPDTQGDVGPDHYFQMVNLSFAIWDKAGNLLYGPVDNSTLWQGFAGPWTGTNDGDPIVLYDEQADRWMASQFAVNTSNGTYWELIAVSKTSDPLGEWYQYAYEFPAFNDYPKAGIWPDGYYFSFNMFGSYNRVAAAAYDRVAMLAGDPNAQMVLFDLPQGAGAWSMLPADCDGTPPIAGTPCYFAYASDNFWTGGTDQIVFWTFSVDWNNTANSQFQQAFTLPVEPYDSYFCAAPRGACLPQKGTSQGLETLSDRLMFRLQYRNFGTHEVMLTCHTVNVDGQGHAGVRWYEFRKPNASADWGIYQQGTYAPDSIHRWMGSVAMNANGNIALGFSVTGEEKYPSMRYTGRSANAPLGVMNFEEIEVATSTGSQSSYGRWGDYAMMSVDPADDTTFWYTNEYLKAGWKTRVVAFDFGPLPDPEANAGPDSTVCKGQPYATAVAEANHYRLLQWNTAGDGYFVKPNDLKASYISGPGDREAGHVTLWLTAFGYGANAEASDTMELYYAPNPLCNAGPDTTILYTSYALLHGTTSNSDSLLWTTSGDGTFLDPHSASTTYTPGPTDISLGTARLKLSAYPQEHCPSPATDQLKVTVDGPVALPENAETLKLSINPNPAHDKVTLSVVNNAAWPLKMTVLNLLGETVFAQVFTTPVARLIKDINVSHLKAGTYFVKIEAGKTLISQKLIVQ